MADVANTWKIVNSRVMYPHYSVRVYKRLTKMLTPSSRLQRDTERLLQALV